LLLYSLSGLIRSVAELSAVVLLLYWLGGFITIVDELMLALLAMWLYWHCWLCSCCHVALLEWLLGAFRLLCCFIGFVAELMFLCCFIAMPWLHECIEQLMR